MGTNKYNNHLLILPEDDAYRDIANGFVRHAALVAGAVKIEKPSRGWEKLLKNFSDNYVNSLRKYSCRYILLLLDLDGDSDRCKKEIPDSIPVDLKDRVFFLCARDEAENIKSELGGGHSERIGQDFAQSCYDGSHADTGSPWCCEQLEHNKSELARLAQAVRPFIFQPSGRP